MPINLYGPGDNSHPENSHVLPALLRRFHKARLTGLDEVGIWGTGQPRREFVYVDDMAEASLFVMGLVATTYQANTQPMLSHINVSYGHDVTIGELAHLIATETGFAGTKIFDPNWPDGSPRKLLDVSCSAAMGWQATTHLGVGLRQTFEWFLVHTLSLRESCTQDLLDDPATPLQHGHLLADYCVTICKSFC